MIALLTRPSGVQLTFPGTRRLSTGPWRTTSTLTRSPRAPCGTSLLYARNAMRARYIDYQTMAEELAVMLCEGRKPTIGWYQRRLRRTEPGVRIE